MFPSSCVRARSLAHNTTMSAATTSTTPEGHHQHHHHLASLLAADVAAAVTARFAALPKTGKPQPHEHTVLAGIVAYHTSSSPKPFAVALGTGTKCLGGSKRSAAGDVLHDSHAEVIVRRAFVAWVCHQLALAAAAASRGQQEEEQAAESSAFTWCPDSKAFVLRPGIEFALYVSQPPCGDASIYQGSADASGQGSTEQQLEQQRRPQSAGRTGAKLLKHAGAVDVGDAAAAATAAAVAAGGTGSTTQQQQQASSLLAAAVPGPADVEAGPQQLGCVRRKPGKGDPTLSLSCSDKIARWCCLGLQGGLMAGLLRAPLYLSLLVVAAPPAGGRMGDAGSSNGAQAEQQQQQVVMEQAALEAASRRAFGERLAGCAAVLPSPFRVAAPHVVAVAAPDAALGLWPSEARKAPAGMSINWSCQQPLLQALARPMASSGKPSGAGVLEATLSALGIKAGSHRKGPAAADCIKTRSRISSAVLWEAWQAVVAALPALAQAHQEQAQEQQRGSTSGLAYAQAKRAAGSPAYRAAWAALRQQAGGVFAAWIAKEMAAEI